MLVALNVMEDDVTQKMGQSGACEIHRRKFGTSRPDILTAGCEQFCKEASEHGWMVLPPVGQSQLLSEARLRLPRLVVSTRSVMGVRHLAKELVELGCHFVLRVQDKQKEEFDLPNTFPDTCLVHLCPCEFGGSEHGRIAFVVSSRVFQEALETKCDLGN